MNAPPTTWLARWLLALLLLPWGLGAAPQARAADAWQATAPIYIPSFASDTNYIQTVAIDRVTPSTVYASGRAGGVSISRNGGASWDRLALTYYRVRVMAMHSSGQTLFLGVQDAASAYQGIYKGSSDGSGGFTWAQMNNGLGNLAVHALALSLGQTLFAGTDGGVYKSTDGGANWVAASNGLGAVKVISLALHSNGQTLFAGTDSQGVFKSTNGGASWVAVNNGREGGTRVPALALHSDGLTLFSGGNGGGVFKSTNGGATWVAANRGMESQEVLSMVLHSDGQTLFAGTWSGVYKSTNGGATWARADSGMGSKAVWALALHSDGQTLLAGSNVDGVFKSTNGALSSDTRLRSLALQAGGAAVALSPAFDPDTETYTATVLGTTLTLTPTAWVADQTLSASVNGVSVPVTSGSATAPRTLSLGSNTVRVVVAPGDGVAAPRTYTVTVVAQAQPTLTLAWTAGGNPSAHGASVGFTATLAGGSGPTGTVTFRDGATVLCTVAAPPYTCTSTTLAVGAHSITAHYAGDTNNTAVTSGALTHNVSQAQPTLALALTAGGNPSAHGASVGFTATLAGGSSPTGTVTFLDGATVLCTVAAPPYACTPTALALGAHTITASYAGDTNNATATSGALTHTVSQALPTLALALTAGNNPSVHGARVTFTATLAGGSSPTGAVTFLDGATVLCTVAAPPYTCTTTALALGARTITAHYAGDTHNATATATAVTHAVLAPTPVPTLGAWGVWLLSWLAAVLGMRRLRPARAGAPRRT